MEWGNRELGRARAQARARAGTAFWGASALAGVLAVTITRKIPAPSGWLWPERTRDITGHWSDAFNFLDLIPGPAFLLIYLVYCTAVIAIAWFIRNCLLHWYSSPPLVNDLGRLPFSLKPSYLDVAYLRDGRNGMLAAAVCNLVRMGILSPLMELLPPSYTPKGLKGEPRTLTDLERAICNAVERRVGTRSLSRDSLVTRELSLAESNTRAKLDALGFCTTATVQRTALITSAVAVLLIDGLGVIRLIRSSLRGYSNVELLVMLMIFATVIGLKVLLSVERHHIGARFLRRLKSDAAAAIRRMQAKTTAGDSADVMYAIAACGTAALHGTIYQEAYERLAPRPEPLSYSSDSGSSCSSCSGGSCGGGSCGGGGCGGGGCGGG